MSEKLKPCPFCGNDGLLFKAGDYHYVKCSWIDLCPVEPETDICATEEEAIMIWNTRFSDKETTNSEGCAHLDDKTDEYMPRPTDRPNPNCHKEDNKK